MTTRNIFFGVREIKVYDDASENTIWVTMVTAEFFYITAYLMIGFSGPDNDSEDISRCHGGNGGIGHLEPVLAKTRT